MSALRRIAMTAALTAVIFAILPAAARAQDGAPVPLGGYVPLPPGMEAEPIEYYLEGAEIPAAPAPVADIAVVDDTPAAPPAYDPLSACMESTGSTGALHDCMKRAHAESEAALQGAVVAELAQAREQGRQAQQELTGANMGFAAARDEECQRQKNTAADKGEAQRIEWACRAVMNDMRITMLRQPQ